MAHALASAADPAAVLLKARGVLKMHTALADDMRQIELFRRLDSDVHRELFAADAMRRRLSGSVERLPEIIAQHRDYFGPV
ncbi:MAG: hypothetical protein CML46_04485 [Rhodobacteraceae bacterium]|nr:hypothetical protein [Paracoccaceae bacterium]MBR26195.1 hypothetical protein [Paracoccaceae bacterium]